MRSPGSLRQWIQQLLPEATSCTQATAAQLLRAQWCGFTANLSQLARQLDRDGTAKAARQLLARFLKRADFVPETLYTQLLNVMPRELLSAQAAPLPLLIDATFFAQQWVVLQVSIPWQRRALPLLRIIQPYQGEARSQAEAVATALQWLRTHLPGGPQRYVLVMDRGFPGHAFLNQLRAGGWRFIIRIEGRWRVEHAHYVGSLLDLDAALPVGPMPGILTDARLGEPARGPQRSSQAHVVYFRGVGHAAPWYLVTSETDPCVAVAVYRQRMQIEQEFRDLKGYWGLDHLAEWLDQKQVEAFLAWVAVYEWRLAYLWQTYELWQWQKKLRVGGRLSWIRTVREWLNHQLRLLEPIPDLRL